MFEWLWRIDNRVYVPGNPYNWRTWMRGHLPHVLSDMILKGWDCEKVGSNHRWYNRDDKHSACYHCESVRRGKLWKRQ